MTSIQAITFLIKNLVGSDTGTSDLPKIIQATVKSVDAGRVLLIWNQKQIEAMLETQVRVGETLLLRFREKKEGQDYYRILARFEEEPAGSHGGLQAVIYAEENHPTVVSLKRYGKAEHEGVPCFDIVIPTANFGFMGIRVFTLNKPYHCCFLVEKEEYGRLFQDLAAIWFSDELPQVVFRSFQLINSKNYGTQNAILDRKA